MFRHAILSALALGALSVPAFAHPDAEAVIAGAAQDLVRGEFTATDLDGVIASDAIARFTLGRHARTLPAADISRFSEAFDSFVDEAFAGHSARFQGSDIQIIGSTDRSARDSIVTTRVTLTERPPETVRWRVIKRNEGWKIVDLQVQGLWLAIEQRAQIGAILDRTNGDIDAAIANIGDASDEYAQANRSGRRG